MSPYERGYSDYMAGVPYSCHPKEIEWSVLHQWQMGWIDAQRKFVGLDRCA